MRFVTGPRSRLSSPDFVTGVEARTGRTPQTEVRTELPPFDGPALQPFNDSLTLTYDPLVTSRRSRREDRM